MGAGSSSSPRGDGARRNSSRSPRSRSQSPVASRREGDGEGRRLTLEKPPRAAIRAADSRGDVVPVDTADGQAVLLCLCRPRRLELLVNDTWVKAIEHLGVRRTGSRIELLAGEDHIADIPLQEAALVRKLSSLARLATRACIPHDLWRDIREAGADMAQSEVCYYCGKQLFSAPSFCSATGRLHPIPLFQGGDPPPESDALQAAIERGDSVDLQTEAGTVQQLVFINTGRLEKVVDGVWKRPVTRLEVPHVGARTLRDYHMSAPTGCLLKAEGLRGLFWKVAVLADRASVDHNLWVHTDPPPTCSICQQPSHTVPICPVTGRSHNPDPSLTPAGSSGELRVRRHLSGPSATPPELPVTADQPPESAHPSRQQGEPGESSSRNPGRTSSSGEESLNNVTGPAGDECCICLEEPKNTVLMPCRHLCVCSGCAQILTQCPLCRFAVVHRFEVF